MSMEERHDPAKIEELINEIESVQSDLTVALNKVWEFKPPLSECEAPIGWASSGVERLLEYLEDQKKAAQG